MDLSAILPLLTRTRNGDSADLLTSLLPKNEKTDEMMKLMSLMKDANKPRPAGLRAIRNIAPDDILGALVKYFDRPQR